MSPQREEDFDEIANMQCTACHRHAAIALLGGSINATIDHGSGGTKA
jgi:hypothetical protein